MREAPAIARADSGRIHWLESTGSTNDLALAARQDGLVFCAKAQTSGRGQRGAHWHSSPGMGLWLSVCLEGSPSGLPFAAALAVRDALVPRLPVRIKWPNDLYAGGRKLGGVLVEHRAGWNALGIGVNVLHRTSDFAPDIQETATSIFMETGTAPPLEQLLDDVLREVDLRVRQLREDGYRILRNEWAEACGIIGKTIHRDGVTGRVVDLDHDGALLVETETCIARVDHSTVRVLENSPCSS